MQALVLDRDAELLTERLEELAVGVADRLRMIEVQVEHAERALVGGDRGRRDRAEAGAQAGIAGDRERGVAHVQGQRQPAALRRLAAHAFAAGEDLLAIEEVLAQPVVNDHAQVARLEVEQARRTRARTQRLLHALEEALAQRIDVVGLAQEGDDVVKDLELAVLLFQAAGLGRDALLERVVDALQVGGHAIEAGRELAELVLGQYRHAGVEIFLAHALDALVELEYGADHGEEEEAQQQDRADHCERDQDDLRGAQDVGVARVALLHAQHELIDRVDAGLGGGIELEPAQVQVLRARVGDDRAQDRAAARRPVVGHLRQVFGDAVLAWHEQRP